MSKPKATKSGKLGKHNGQDTFLTVFLRSLRMKATTDPKRCGSPMARSQTQSS